VTAIKSFNRLSDGLKTVFVANPDGNLVDLVDVRDFAAANAGADLPAPSAARYQAHALATLRGGHLGVVARAVEGHRLRTGDPVVLLD